MVGTRTACRLTGSFAQVAPPGIEHRCADGPALRQTAGMVLGMACALFAAVAYGGASVLQGVGARRAESSSGLDPALMVRLAGSVPYVCGLGLDLGAFVASLVALRTMPLFLVQSAVASSVGVTAAIAAAVGARLRGREIASLVVLGAGLLLLATSAQPEQGTPLTLGVRWGLLACVVVLGAAGTLAARVNARSSAPVLGVLAGLAFTVVAVTARSLTVPSPAWHVLADPGLWAILAHGVLGMLLFTTALQRGSVTSATAVTFAVETIVPAGVGLAFLGDTTRPGYALVAAVGFLLTIAGTLALATHDITMTPVEGGERSSSH
jgi:drug/metabolite transporter (DMT)-like permease